MITLSSLGIIPESYTLSFHPVAAHSPLVMLFPRLPWEVAAITLADTIDGYKQQEKQLISEFKRLFGFLLNNSSLNVVDGEIVHWVERCRPRKCVIFFCFCHSRCYQTDTHISQYH